MRLRSLLIQRNFSYLIALLAGASVPLAFAPCYFFWLATLAPALLLLLWLFSTPKQAFIKGWLFGLGMFGVGISWVFISIHRYGNTNIPLAATFTFMFIAVLALFPGMQGFLLARFFPIPNKRKALLAFPSLWILLEMLRSSLLTGFPWLILGDSQAHSPLRGFAPIVGEFGISFLLLFCSGLIALACYPLLFPSSSSALKNHFRYWRQTICVLCLIILWSTGGLLAHIQWTTPVGKPIQVTLVQGNIPQEIKWSPDYAQRILRLYPELTAPHWKSQLIVWPEGAIPVPLPSASAFLTALDKKAKAENTRLITGIPIRVEKTFNYYNSLVLLGRDNGFYYKRHLVPFGEYLPFDKLLRGIIGFFNIPMSDFVKGPDQQPLLHAANIKIAAFICYEIVYSNLVRQALPSAELLLTVSDDNWFGDSLAPAQHLQIAQMRSLQTGRMQLFAANSGITAIINQHGKIQNILPQFQATSLTGTAQAMQGTTPWVKFGNPIIYIITTFLFLAIARWP